MRLGTGTVNLPNSHPAAVAAQVAMLDHMLDGRFNFGISPGGLMSDAEVFGNLDSNRNAMFLEAIDFIVRIWTSEPPYALEGKFWNVSTARTMMADIGQGLIAKPLQKPHPPIVVTAVSPYSQGVAEAAVRGWYPISANFLLPKWVATHWSKYTEGCARAGKPADPANWRVAKSHLRRRRSGPGESLRARAAKPVSLLLPPAATKLLKAAAAISSRKTRTRAMHRHARPRPTIW